MHINTRQNKTYACRHTAQVTTTVTVTMTISHAYHTYLGKSQACIYMFFTTLFNKLPPHDRWQALLGLYTKNT